MCKNKNYRKKNSKKHDEIYKKIWRQKYEENEKQNYVEKIKNAQID